MAAVTRGISEDVRRAALSPRSKGRGKSARSPRSWRAERGYDVRDRTDGGIEIENAKDTLCRNVTIYGHCRYEDKGILCGRKQVNRKLNRIYRLCLQSRSSQGTGNFNPNRQVYGKKSPIEFVTLLTMPCGAFQSQETSEC